MFSQIIQYAAAKLFILFSLLKGDQIVHYVIAIRYYVKTKRCYGVIRLCPADAMFMIF